MDKPKIVLEVKIKRPDGVNTFYRYRIKNVQFWFEETNDGNIYSVYINANNDKLEYFLDCEYDETLEYPVFRPLKTRFRHKNGFITAEESDDFIESIKDAKIIASAIDAFFENGKFD